MAPAALCPKTQLSKVQNYCTIIGQNLVNTSHLSRNCDHTLKGHIMYVIHRNRIVFMLALLLTLLWMPHPVVAQGGVHVVQRGQTLYSIARRYGTTVSAIMQANGLTNSNFVWVGQRLRIPSGGSSAGSSSGGSAGRIAGRWVEVVLSSQRAVAWQGNAPVRTMVVSTGIARYPTPSGRFHIYAKYRSTAMSGPGYYLPGVPHTMFFYRGYALHGTYWHRNFGRPMSHGCVNLTRGDAAWLYSWAPVGTLVVIRY